MSMRDTRARARVCVLPCLEEKGFVSSYGHQLRNLPVEFLDEDVPLTVRAGEEKRTAFLNESPCL